MTQLEPQIRKVINQTLNSLSFSVPAKVVSIRNIKDGLIDVQPLINKYMFDFTNMQRPQINDVPIITPSTIKSAIVLPISEGDTVLLLFNQNNIEEFKDGNLEPHLARDFSLLDPSSAVALIGFNTKLDSVYNNDNFNNEIDNENLNIVHNIGEENEVLLSFNSDGEVSIKAKKVNVDADEVNVKAEKVNVDASTIDAKNSLIKTNNEVEIKGLRVYENLVGHTHNYTDNGNPMITSPSNTI